MQCGSSACVCLLPDCTALCPRGQQSSKKDNAIEEGGGGKQYASFKFTHAHIIYVYVVPMCYICIMTASVCHTKKNFSPNNFASRSKSQSEKGSFKCRFVTGIYLKGGNWNNRLFPATHTANSFLSKLVLLIRTR